MLSAHEAYARANIPSYPEMKDSLTKLVEDFILQATEKKKLETNIPWSDITPLHMTKEQENLFREYITELLSDAGYKWRFYNDDYNGECYRYLSVSWKQQ